MTAEIFPDHVAEDTAEMVVHKVPAQVQPGEVTVVTDRTLGEFLVIGSLSVRRNPTAATAPSAWTRRIILLGKMVMMRLTWRRFYWGRQGDTHVHLKCAAIPCEQGHQHILLVLLAVVMQQHDLGGRHIVTLGTLVRLVLRQLLEQGAFQVTDVVPCQL